MNTKTPAAKATTRASKRVTSIPAKPDADGFLVGISRAPITIAIPPNISAAFRAAAVNRDTGVCDEILAGLISTADLALDESEREDVPGALAHEEWLREDTNDFGAIIAPRFTDEQWARLRSAARIVEAETDLRRVTVEELIVAGALSLLDFHASSRKEAAAAIGEDINAYARRKETFAQPEHGTHDALQSPDTAPHRRTV